MYPSASAGNPVKTVLRNGALIDSLGDEVVADGIAWMPIRSPNGQTGYIRGDTRVGTPSRFYYFRHVSSFYFWNLWIGAFIFVCGVVLTLGGYLFARYVIGGGIFFIFYGMILTGFGQFFVALRRLNVEIAIQRRKYRERLR
jgi:hypothetical protein